MSVGLFFILQVPTFGSGLGPEVLSVNGDLDDQCSITYGWLADGGDAAFITTQVIPKAKICDKASFAKKVEGLFAFKFSFLSLQCGSL